MALLLGHAINLKPQKYECFVNSMFHQLDVSSTWCFVNLMMFHQLDDSSTWCFINLMFHQLDVSSTWCFINTPKLFQMTETWPRWIEGWQVASIQLIRSVRIDKIASMPNIKLTIWLSTKNFPIPIIQNKALLQQTSYQGPNVLKRYRA